MQTLLNACLNLVNADLHEQLSAFTATVNRAIVPHAHTCDACSDSLYDLHTDSQLVCFK